MINANKPNRWKADIAASVDQYNKWFVEFAPVAFRTTRAATAKEVTATMLSTQDFARLEPALIEQNPSVVRTLRMATAPPLAVDRLVGLSYAKQSLVKTLETGQLPKRMKAGDLQAHLVRISAILSDLLDVDIFPWLTEGRSATEVERSRAASVVADRLCGAIANPIIRNAQEQRQLAVIKAYLEDLGYREQSHPTDSPLTDMEPGTFAFRMNVEVEGGSGTVNIPVDVVLQPREPASDALPVLIEAKSAGDFTNTNKRRKEEATKVRQLTDTYGDGVRFVLFLCGYFNSGYLGYEAAEGIDWVWEHRVNDLMELGL